ncbi:MAG: ferrochelatase [Bdellovibrionota bacterium]
MQNKKIGVLLINLGTPNSFLKKDVRIYLKEFLSDKRVIDIPWLFRFLLLYFIILPFRTKKSAKAYKSIWLKNGSPLKVYSEQLVAAVQTNLGNQYAVELGMRYQNPSIKQAIKNLVQKNVSQIIVFPLFPQYASAASGSALEKVYDELKNAWNVIPITTVPAFYNNNYFIQCFVNRIKESLKKFQADYVLFSYHGLPERHILKSGGDINFCYKQQCFATTQAIVEKLKFEKNFYSSSFQSRLGRAKWIEPYTDFVLPELAQKGFKKLLVVCPAFVADCLETVEEIAIRAKEQWISLGGENLVLVPSLNAEEDWVQSVATIVKEHVHEY